MDLKFTCPECQNHGNWWNPTSENDIRSTSFTLSKIWFECFFNVESFPFPKHTCSFLTAGILFVWVFLIHAFLNINYQVSSVTQVDIKDSDFSFKAVLQLPHRFRHAWRGMTRRIPPKPPMGEFKSSPEMASHLSVRMHGMGEDTEISSPSGASRGIPCGPWDKASVAAIPSLARSLAIFSWNSA